MPDQLEGSLPNDLQQLIGPAQWHQEQIGMSGTDVYRLQRAHEWTYLKVATGYAAYELREETRRLRWLHGRLPVPDVLYAAEVEDTSYLLMSAVPGLIACAEEMPLAPAVVTRLLAAGMQQMHALAIADCPFDQRIATRLPLAQQRIQANLVDSDDFDAERQGRTPESVFDELLVTHPATEDVVFTHGDYCLPNILIDTDRQTITGFIDLARAGIADRHQDLALCARSLTYNLGEEWVPLLFDIYGREHIDPAKLYWYQMLDELF